MFASRLSLIHVRFHDCANAVGAAISKVSGDVDVIEVLEGRDEEAVVAAACEEAKRKAIEVGADEDLVQVVSVEAMPLEYVQMRAARLVVRAVSQATTCVSSSF